MRQPLLLTDSIANLKSYEIRRRQLFVTGDFPLEVAVSDTTLRWQPVRGAFEAKEDFYCWNKITFRNEGLKVRHDFLIFFSNVREPKAYLFREGKLIYSATGENMDALPGLGNSLPLSLRPGEEQTLYFHGLFEAGVYSNPPVITSLSDGARVIKSRVAAHYKNYLYAGIMLSLVVMSLLLFGLFRERMFIFFAFMAFGFIVYFQVISFLSGVLSFSWLRFGWVWPLDIGLIFIVLGSTGFIFDYLNLDKRKSWRSRTFIALAILAMIVCLFTRSDLLDLHWRTRGMITNFAISLWMAMAIYVMVHHALKAVPEAKILLAAMTAMVLFGMAYLVSNTFYSQASSFFRLLQIGSVIFSGIIFVGLYNKVGYIRAKTTQLSSQNSFITRFFTNISHEFRTPLTLMLGPVEQLLERNTVPADRELLTIVQRNAQRQLGLINQILDLARLEATQLLLHARKVDVVPVLRRIVSTYKSVGEQRQIDFSLQTELEALVLRVETEKLETICYNLLTNAFKFTPDGGEITVDFRLENGEAVLTVRDNGSGIKASVLPHIFDRFYSDDEHKYTQTAGSGVGLALTRELVRLHGGEITAASKPGKETTFRITLPYEPGLAADRVVETPVEQTATKNIFVPEADAATPASAAGLTATPAAAPLVVVVEDNPDLQAFLANSLSSRYRVRVAANGREGLALIEQVMPDLVISDVMMPEMDGFTMCKQLKSRLSISHIPVILLTARSTSEDLVAGLDTGADDYLTKPFHQKELLARARNLVESRKLLRERFAASITLKPEEVTSTSVDQAFLQAALQAVEKNIDREDFKVDALARELGISRTGLNRKFRALLDQSTNQFIQSVRLERAADLLQKQDLTVGAIAMETGFGSTGYFIRCFRDKFGETPGEFRKGGQKA